MSDVTRLQYLEAMGIQVWTRRQPLALEPDDIPEPIQEEPGEIDPAVFIEVKGNESPWPGLQSEVAGCRKCGLCESRTQTVFGTGNEHADWMIIGEAPGQSEDEQGKPFVGRAGQLLTEMLRAVGLQREDVFITNILKCRPPNNRDPKPDEVEACHDYLQRQIDWVKPKIILAIGRIAAQNLLKTDQPLSRLRGSVHHLDDTPVIVIYHPAYLLRSLLEKRKAWDDLQLAMATFNAIKG
ncbi:MAG: uracil-DNA glycosylase [Gammaproteobacteria bacterium]